MNQTKIFILIKDYSFQKVLDLPLLLQNNNNSVKKNKKKVFMSMRLPLGVALKNIFLKQKKLCGSFLL